MKAFMNKGVKFRSVFDDFQDSERRAQQILEAQKNQMIVEEVTAVINSANELALILTDASDEKKFVMKLIGYLQSKIKTLSTDYDYVTIRQRARIVKACIEAIHKKDIAAITQLLEEKNIKQIKGIFSSHMYHILSSFQNYPRERRDTLFQSLQVYIPSALLTLIHSYDGTLGYDEGEDDKENQRPQ